MALIINGNEVPYVEVAYADVFYSAPSRITSRELISGGTVVTNSVIGEDTVPVNLIISRRASDNPTWQQVMEDIHKALLFDEEVKVVVEEHSDRFWRGRVVSFEITEIHEYVAKGVVNIFLPKSWRYGDEKSFNTDGFLLNEGISTASWWVTSDFTSSDTMYELKFNDGSDGRIKLNYSFSDGDKLIIDFNDKTIKVNGSRIDDALDIQSMWKELPKGSVDIKASNESTLFYEEKFR